VCIPKGALVTNTRQVVRVLGVTALALGAVGGLHDATSGAEGSSTFALRARADSVGVQLIAKDAPAVSIGGGEVAFVTPASAQSELDSLGGSRSFASSPYPGDLVISLPGTVSGLLGGVSFPVPGYPFFVTSEHPVQPDADEEVGPYSIAAHSAAGESHAEAHVGLSTAPPQVVSVTSRTSVSRDPATGRAEAVATTEVAPLSVSAVLRLGDVRATASVSIDPARPDAVVKRSSLSVGTVTVAGVELGLTDQGLSAGGTSLVPVDLSAVTALLAGSGVSIEVLPAQETATSVTSAGLRVTFQQVFPTLGETTVRRPRGHHRHGRRGSARGARDRSAPRVRRGSRGPRRPGRPGGAHRPHRPHRAGAQHPGGGHLAGRRRPERALPGAAGRRRARAPELPRGRVAPPAPPSTRGTGGLVTEPTQPLPRRPRPARPRTRPLRRVGIGAVVALLAVTVGALVTNSPLDAATSGSGVSVDVAGTADAPATDVPTGGSVPSSSAFSPTDGGVGANDLDLGVGAVAGSVGAAGPTPGGASTGAAAPAESTVIVHPVLQLFAFGGQIGMPLICSLAIGGVGPALSDPGVSAVVGQILAACVSGANQGADSLRALDAQLSALAAINPAVGPVLDQLAAALDSASTADAPFLTYLLQISALVRFFRG
jgi:hypothetical protein